MKKMIGVFLLAFLWGITGAWAGEHPMGPYKGSAEFERLKTLTGTWEGTHRMGDKEESVTVEYEVSSNGSVVVETLFPKTPHEMVSVYYDKNGKLSMTHYCALGNQPQMDLKSSDEKTLTLDLARSQKAINVKKDDHMHGLKISWDNADAITHEWAYYTGGKQTEMTTFQLTRVKSN